MGFEAIFTISFQEMWGSKSDQDGAIFRMLDFRLWRILNNEPGMEKAMEIDGVSNGLSLFRDINMV